MTINYACWGPIYLSDIDQLPENLKCEFMRGNFAVKRSAHTFNQVDPDQAQEWLNGTCKKGGGIVGITKSKFLKSWLTGRLQRITVDTESLILSGIILFFLAQPKSQEWACFLNL